MADLKQLLQEMSDVAANPKAVLGKYLSQGKKVVGCFPIYTPQELVHAGGMIPMGLWGGQVNPTVAGRYNPIFTCSLMRSCLEYGMNGVYNGLSCAIMPMLCDTFRGTSGAWRAGVKDIPLVAFIHPQNRTDSGAREFLAEEYDQVRRLLEEHTGGKITDEALERSIEIYNEHAAVIREFVEVANDHLDVITPVVRHNVMKSATFLEKGEHTAKVRAIIAALKQLPVHQWQGKKVILTGITAEPDAFLGIFAENNIAVVGDDLAQESRQYRTPIPAGKTSVDRLAGQWLNRIGCSTVHEEESSRGRMLVEMARRYGAHGVAVCLMRFCDVEEYDYPFISKAVEEAGFHSLCLEIDQSTQNNEQSRTKIQSFAEME